MKLLLATTALALSLAPSLATPALAQAAGPANTASGQDGQAPGASQPGSGQPGSAPDQDTEASQPGGGIQDIIVTAQRREQSVQDVPIAISAFTGDQLASQGVSNTLQLGQYVPNLVAQNNTGIGSANAYYLRGLGNTESIATFDPPVGTYVDDVYLSRQNANNLSLFDVERVEVLRGPQGTLFGRNTTGGAINIILRQPELGRFGGYGEVAYGRYNKKLARASVDVPLAPTFSAKLSGYWQDDDGYVKNTTTGDRLNDDDGWGVRLGLRGELSPSVRWSGSYAHIVANGENILNFDCDPGNPANCDGRFVTTGLREAKTITPSPYVVPIYGPKATFGQGQRSDTEIVTSNLQIGLAEKTTLTLITGFVALTQRFALDFFDGRSSPTIANLPPPNYTPAVRRLPMGGFDILNDGRHEQFSQEIKLNTQLFDGALNLVSGLYYLSEDNRTDFADVLGLSPTAALLIADRTLRNSTTAKAAYAQADFNLTGSLQVTAGIRYTDERKNFTIRDNRPTRITTASGTTLCGTSATAAPTALCLDDANLIAPTGLRIPQRQSAKLWTPRFALNFRPNSDLLVFASATRGFKSGGWNARESSPVRLLPFGPEKVWSYEAGFKSDLFDRRVRFNLTGFYLDVKDLQTISGFTNPDGTLAFINRNFANYRNKGLEAELTLAPVRGLNLYANGGYQDDKYLVPRSAPDFDIYGVQSVNAQQRECQAALAAGKVPGPGAPNLPAGSPRISACASGIVTARGQIATPVRTPKYSAALGASYEVPLGTWSFVPTVNASWRSRQEVQTSNISIYTGTATGTNGTFPTNLLGGQFITGSRSDPAWLVNAGLSLFGPDKRWQLAVECTNCLDEQFIQSSLGNFSYLNQPMFWNVRARVNF
jgi:iron complex outermembrane receptor protein